MDHVHCHCPDYRIRDHDSRTGTSGRRRSVHRLWPTSRPTSCPTLATWAGLFSLSSVASHQTRRGLVPDLSRAVIGVSRCSFCTLLQVSNHVVSVFRLLKPHAGPLGPLDPLFRRSPLPVQRFLHPRTAPPTDKVW